MRPRRPHYGIALGLLALCVASCGRKGPLELPADVQAERQAQAAQAAAAVEGHPSGRRPKLSEEGAPPPPPGPALGDPSNRPPAVYPFPLDFLL